MYVDNGAFLFEDHDQLKQGLSLIFSHFTRFGIEIHIGKGDKASKNECAFFPTPVYFEWKRILPVDDVDMAEGVLVPKRKQEYYEARHKREDLDYDEFSETRLIFVLDGFFTFCRHFKYLGTWIYFSLYNGHDVAKILAAANASIGAMSNIWDNDCVDIYSKYMLLWAIPCNLLLWGCEIWALQKSLLASLEVFLHSIIRRILKIKMCQVIDQHIKNTSIREMFYNILTVQNQIAFCHITYLGKPSCREY